MLLSISMLVPLPLPLPIVMHDLYLASRIFVSFGFRFAAAPLRGTVVSGLESSFKDFWL